MSTDDFDNEEWGNIQLGDITDEQLFSDTKLNTRLAAKNKSPDWKEKIVAKNKKKSTDKAFIHKMSKICKERASDPEWIAATKKAKEELFADEERYSKFVKKMSDAWTDERKDKHIARVKELAKEGVYKHTDEYREKSALDRAKPFHTPFGVYQSPYHFKKDHPNIKLFNRFNLNPHQYYYVDEGPGAETYEDVFYTPYGKHKYLKGMFDKAKEQNDPNATTKEAKGWFLKMSKKFPDQYYKRKEVKIEWEYIKP